MRHAKFAMVTLSAIGSALFAAALACGPAGASVQMDDPPFVRLWVNETHSWVSGDTLPGTAVTLTLARAGAPLDTQSRIAGDGHFFIGFGGNTSIQTGDVVQMQSSLGITANIDAIAITGDTNVFSDSISGRVNAPGCPVAVRGEIWAPAGTSADVMTDASCNYTVVFSPFDMRMGHAVALWYARPDGHYIGIVRYPLRVQVDLDDERVFGSATPGRSVQVTVTGALLKATTSAVVDSNGNFGTAQYGSGMAPGDTITVTSGLNRVVVRTPMTLTAQIDAVADTIRGYGPPSMTLNGSIPDAPGLIADFTITTDETGYYSLTTSQPPYNYDLQPSDMGQIGVVNDDLAWAFIHFGGADVWLQMNGTGAQAAPGGHYAYQMEFGVNRVPASSIVITALLPAGVRYVGNDTGYPVDIFGSQVVITVGALHADNRQEMQLVVAFDGNMNPGDPVRTEASIGASQPERNPGDNSSSFDMTLAPNSTDLNVWKNARTGDPSPGQPFIYQIGYRNNGNTGSAVVRITDTLPVSTTFLNWWADEAGWTLVQSGTQVVWQRDTILGNQGNWLYLVAQLDDRLGLNQTLHNQVEIFTPNDTNAGNNNGSQDVNTNLPRRDLFVNAGFDSGSTTPGGQIYYGLNYNNDGNMIAHAVQLTFTLPPGLSFLQAGYGTKNGWVNVPFSIHTGNDYVWNLGTLIPGAWGNFQVLAQVSDTLPGGSILTATARIMAGESESRLGNNTAIVVEKIYPSGPNLRVWQGYDWNGNNQLGYRAHFLNTGDQTLNNVWLTDVLPAGATWNDWMQIDFDQSRIVSTTTSGGMLKFELSTFSPGENGWIYFNADLDEPDARPRWYTNTVMIGTPPGEVNPADNTLTTVAVKPEVVSVELWVGSAQSSAWGNAGVGPVTLTTAYTRAVTTAQPWCNGCWNMNDIGPVWPGEVVTVEAGSGAMPVVIHAPAPFTAQVDSTLDRVTGQIGGAAGTTIWVHPNWMLAAQEVSLDAAGNYTATFAEVPRGGQGNVRYLQNINYAEVYLHRSFAAPDLMLRTNYGHDNVEGNYQETGHTVWLTVTNAAGTLKARATMVTMVVPWWNGSTGFSTNVGNPWSPSRPDILPGDWVYASMDNGQQTASRVGTLTGNIDPASDNVSGTVITPWFTRTLDVECQSWGAPPGVNNKQSTAAPDGSAPYACSWAGEWDIPPGNDIGVFYTEPEGNQVGNAFRISASSLRINTYASGNPGEGGNYSFQVQYWNDGDAPAENVVITDVLQGFGFLSDTLGFIPVTGTLPGGNNYARWNLGTIPASGFGQFTVYARVMEAQGAPVSSHVSIATSNPFDTGNTKQWTWNGTVQANDTRLTVDMHAWTGDPAAGYDTVFAMNVCNKGQTGSSPALLTDTLHPSMTLVSWWSQYAGWTQVLSRTDMLVVTHPTIDPYGCGEVYVRAHLDAAAWSGMQITNSANVHAANDTTLNDNGSVWNGRVNDPHTNLNINDEWNGGILVPGGMLRYNVGYNNSGNVPVTSPIRITFTLPVSATFREAWFRRPNGNNPRATPVFTGTDAVVFQLNGLDNGYGDMIEVMLDVADDAATGTVLTSVARISPQPREDNGDDNTSLWVEKLYEHGPNVRVCKRGQWDDWGEFTRRASFNLKVENVGDVMVQPVVLTDTYPAGMRLDGGIGFGFWRWWDWRDHPDQHYFTVALELLEPGWMVNINMALITDTQPLPFGMRFTNTVILATDSSDTNPADNESHALLTTGPDLYTQKTLVAGDPKPGALVTFSVRFGNGRTDGVWWWNTRGSVIITDMLPAGMSYVASYQHFCGLANWCERAPDSIAGGQLVWDYGQMGPGWWDEFYVVARITDTAQPGAVLMNEVAVGSTDPSNDVEPLYTNNMAAYALTVVVPRFAIDKTYRGNRVAGTTITYTLNISNTGNQAATSVVVSDAVPAGLTYGSGGSYTGVAVTWVLPVIAPNSAAVAQFTGTLQCATGSVVTNQVYRVTGSNQGVASGNGAPVSFTTIAPVINTSVAVAYTETVPDWGLAFTAIATTTGARIASYEWSFGDGITGTGPVVAHAYTQTGTFVVSLVARDSCGFTSVAPATSTIYVIAGSHVAVMPGVSSTLVYTSATDNTVAVVVPGGAVTQSIELRLTPQVTATGAPSLFKFAGTAFDLVAYRSGQPLVGYQFNAPLTVTIHYSDTMLGGLDESSLRLWHWTGTTWADAAVGPYSRSMAKNWLSVPIQHLTHFALFGQHRIFLPVARK